MSLSTAAPFGLQDPLPVPLLPGSVDGRRADNAATTQRVEPARPAHASPTEGVRRASPRGEWDWHPPGDLSWQARANCAAADPRLFSEHASEAEHAEAVQFCHGCRVLTECSRWAAKNGLQGVAGGEVRGWGRWGKYGGRR